MGTIPILNEHHSEWTPSQMAQSRMNTILNGHHPEWNFLSGHHPEWTSSQVDTIPNEHLHLYSYFGVFQLLFLLQKRGFMQKLIF